jgi:hypothetical protein
VSSKTQAESRAKPKQCRGFCMGLGARIVTHAEHGVTPSLPQSNSSKTRADVTVLNRHQTGLKRPSNGRTKGSLVGKCPSRKLMPISLLRASADRHVSRGMNDLTKITCAAEQPCVTEHVKLRQVLLCYYHVVIARFNPFALYCAKTTGNGRVFE